MTPSRFIIVKSCRQPHLYGVLDGINESFVAWADCFRCALEIRDDVERLVLEEAVVDNAMREIGM